MRLQGRAARRRVYPYHYGLIRKEDSPDDRYRTGRDAADAQLYFIASTLTGTFTVADGIIDLDPPLAPGAWVAIEGSGSLDGVHQLDENGKLPDAADGSWRGLLHLLSPTADFLRLCRDIRDWADSTRTKRC